jgi:hypothetical protein
MTDLERFGPEVRESILQMNRKKSWYCPICTKGKKYRPEESIPYLEIDPSALRQEKAGFITATGKCSSLGHFANVDFIAER